MGQVEAAEGGMTEPTLKSRMNGRWKSILPIAGVGPKFLVNKHGPCPMCGGTDRFRFDDKDGNGTWICNHCGSGNGIDLIMKFKGWDFIEVLKMVDEHIGSSKFEKPRASTDSHRDKRQREEMSALWGMARPLDGDDLASRYLHSRGIKLTAYPRHLRFLPETAYWADDQKIMLPCLLAKFAAPDEKSSMLHRTFLSEPGVKASVEKQRMFMPGQVPPGGAVRLFPVEETLGVAEGIETALSASHINRIPVWATCTAGALLKWSPPPEAKHVVIFGDMDASFTGQVSAYSLAYRLKTEMSKTHADATVEVRFTMFTDRGTRSEDWNNVLKAA